MRIAVMIAFRDRATELALLLQSLRTQTIKDFDVFIQDDCSNTPISIHHFLMCLINKMNEEGNFVFYDRNQFQLGVSKNRQVLVDKTRKYELVLRVDDDTILNPDYIERLKKVLDLGYDLATGITPFMGSPMFKRDSDSLEIGNRMIIQDGEVILNNDDFGMNYYNAKIIPIHHFRSCALYKQKIHDKVNYSSRLSTHGFREEQIFSIKCMLNKFKMGCDTGAIAWHLMTPSGGERFTNSNELVKFNEEMFREFVKEKFKEHGNFVEEYNKFMGLNPKPITSEELKKQTNLVNI